MEFGRLVESAFHHRPLACSGIIESDLNFYECFSELLIQVYSATAIPKVNKSNINEKLKY